MFDRDDWLRLAIAPQRWRVRVRALCHDAAPADGLDALRARLREAVSTHALAQLRKRCEQTGVTPLTPVDAAWPPRLGEIPDPPAALFLRGRSALLQGSQIAVVGARRASPRGLNDAAWITRELVRAGFCVTSGLALGIDGAAHRAALAAGGDTIAVLGAGIDRIYPARHRSLAARIMEAGLLVTEFAPGVPAARHHFPQRNRIISGLSLGVLIVEAGEHSGSLITARLAAEQGREVFVMPTTARDPGGAGGHRLIREGATLIRGLDDLLEELPLQLAALKRAGPGIHAPRTASAPGRLADPESDSAEETRADPVLASLDPAGTDLETLLRRTALDAQTLAVRLVELELEGRILRDGDRVTPTP